jgi:serine/threonine-protein kinase
MEHPEIEGYGILASLGTGAGSVIYKAISRADNRVVAVKWVPRRSRRDDRYVRQAENEWNVCRQLQHRNVVQVHDFFKVRGLLSARAAALVMELVEGRPLSEMSGVNLSTLLRIFIQTANALEHVHSKGFSHCDLKPGNVIVRPDGVAKLVDFGIAAPLGGERDRVQGTLDFIAPEQTEPGKVDQRTDIFNFGATMYRVLTGHALPTTFVVGASSSAQPAQRLWSDITKLNPNVPRALSSLVLACCQRRIQDRPAQMRPVVHQLLAVREQLSADAGTTPGGEGQPR